MKRLAVLLLTVFMALVLTIPVLADPRPTDDPAPDTVIITIVPSK